LGKSGSGKSVTIKCMVGLIIPDAGSIQLLGESIENLNEKQFNGLRKKVGFLFQSGALYDSMSVRENLLFPLRLNHTISHAEKNDLVDEVLEGVSLQHAIDKMPSELSGGMRKRVGLARTLMLKPEIMLYDEPTTGLDPVTSREISELILEVQAKYKTTSIIITHDMDCAKLTANKVVILKEGYVLAEGTFDELLKSDDPFIQSFFITVQ
jgi:phospholipid/cholesterol/gamma-HCH transport system ATP-binding protein